MSENTSDTPRTDDRAILCRYHPFENEHVVNAEFARELERELIQTRIQLEAWQSQFKTTQLTHAVALLEKYKKLAKQ